MTWSMKDKYFCNLLSNRSKLKDTMHLAFINFTPGTLTLPLWPQVYVYFTKHRRHIIYIRIIIYFTIIITIYNYAKHIIQILIINILECLTYKFLNAYRCCTKFQ